jgi:tetratricopeptide (TPR) repeat protein
VSLSDIQKLIGEAGETATKLAVLTPGHLPLALTQALLARRGTVVEHARFQELAKSLGLEEYLGEEPRAEVPEPRRRLLPSAQQLDEIMRRGRSWLDWGVPSLALRFYRQALGLKPEFAPARVGIGRSLLALGLTDDAESAFDELLLTHPDDVDARLGKAAVLGARGKVTEEIRLYRALLDEEKNRTDVRAHLVAALVAEGKWTEARREIETMVRETPEDPRVRFLHAAALIKTGGAAAGEKERAKARSLGLTYEQETALSEHLGLPKPERSVASEAAAPTPLAPAENVRISPRKPAGRVRKQRKAK